MAPDRGRFALDPERPAADGRAWGEGEPRGGPHGTGARHAARGATARTPSAASRWGGPFLLVGGNLLNGRIGEGLTLSSSHHLASLALVARGATRRSNRRANGPCGGVRRRVGAGR